MTSMKHLPPFLPPIERNNEDVVIFHLLWEGVSLFHYVTVSQEEEGGGGGEEGERKEGKWGVLIFLLSKSILIGPFSGFLKLLPESSPSFESGYEKTSGITKNANV